MATHPSTFDKLKPGDPYLARMQEARSAAASYARELDLLVPEGPDKDYIMRKLREVAMWVNVAITRDADGAPRQVDSEIPF